MPCAPARASDPDRQGQGPDRVAMPMILATSAVHSWLTRKGLRTFCSLNVRSAECIDPHYFAVLIGCGATVVNAYLARTACRPDRRGPARRS
jgi:glutamate synthase (NADPH/NADH) large chain